MPVKKTTILVADDDFRIQRLVMKGLQLQGYLVLQAQDGEQALDLLVDHTPDLLLLDVMMPKQDGFAVCERVREFSSIPIIIMTACDHDAEKVRGLDLGADDYVTKPFCLDELFARVRSVLRRAQFVPADATTGPHSLARSGGGLVIDYAQHRVHIEMQEVSLTPIEYRILAFLTQYIGRVVTQDMLLEHVWGPGYAGESHMLQLGINRLRRKIERDLTHPRYIRTKVGVGYYLALDDAEEGLAPLQPPADPPR